MRRENARETKSSTFEYNPSDSVSSFDGFLLEARSRNRLTRVFEREKTSSLKDVCFFKERKSCLPEEFEHSTLSRNCWPNKGKILQIALQFSRRCERYWKRSVNPRPWISTRWKGEGDTNGKNPINPTKSLETRVSPGSRLSRWRANSRASL